MTLAMMLPSLFPLLAGVGSMAQSSRQLWTMQVLFIVGYASAWTLFALSAFLGDSLLHWIATYWRWLATHPWVIGTTALAVAGIFQCSSFKQRCLRQCGQLSRWFPQGQGRDSIWCMGAGYGLSCMGSCWALMLVTFGLGMKSPLAMALLTGIIIAEKEFRCRYRFSYTIGSLFLVLALLWGMFPAGLLSI
jgi:predicted metal-binding membrane protein